MSSTAPSVRRLTAWIFGLVILATPFAAYFWETLNQLMMGHVDPLRLLLGVLALLGLLGIWWLMWRAIQRWEDERQPGDPTSGGASP